MTLDLAIIAIYIIAINIIGFRFSKAGDLSGYFLGSHSISWPIALFSIVATETSSLTFLSIPGLAFMTGTGFLYVALGYVVGRIFVATILLPRYFEGNIGTAYGFIKDRFGEGSQRVLAVLFQVTRVMSDGVRLFATAIPLAMLMGTNDYRIPLLVISIATFAYTLYGGIRAVAVTDTVQLFLYLLSAVLALGWIYIGANGPSVSLLAALGELVSPFSHLSFSQGNLFKGYNIVAGITGGALLSLASHGTDQLMVQRVLACKDVKDSKKAMIGSGILVFFQFSLFLFLGLVLRQHFAGRPFGRGDEVMGWFIVHDCPPGLRGIFLSGIFAAAMSTLASSINSLASSTVYDIFQMDKWAGTEKRKVMLSRVISLGWTLVIALVAFSLKNSHGALVELGLSIASLTYGGMLAIFVAGTFRRRTGQGAAMTGLFAGVASVSVLYVMTSVFWVWLVPAGFVTSISVILVLNRIFSAETWG